MLSSVGLGLLWGRLSLILIQEWWQGIILSRFVVSVCCARIGVPAAAEAFALFKAVTVA